MSFNWNAWLQLAETALLAWKKKYQGLSITDTLWGAITWQDGNGCGGVLSDMRDAEKEYLTEAVKPDGERREAFEDWLETSPYKDCDTSREEFIDQEIQFQWETYINRIGSESVPVVLEGMIENLSKDIQVADATGFVKFSTREKNHLAKVDHTKKVTVNINEIDLHTFWRRVYIARKLVTLIEEIALEGNMSTVDIGIIEGFCHNCIAPFTEDDLHLCDAITVCIFQCEHCGDDTGYRHAVAIMEYLLNPGEYNYSWLATTSVLPDACHKMPHEERYPSTFYPIMLTDEFTVPTDLNLMMHGFDTVDLFNLSPHRNKRFDSAVSMTWQGIPHDEDATIEFAYFDTGLIVLGPVSAEELRIPTEDEVSFARDLLLRIGLKERQSYGGFTPIWEGLLPCPRK